MEREEALKKFLTLRGNGKYSLDLVVPSRGFPLDVWSAKIFGVLFFGKVQEDPRGAIPQLKKEAGIDGVSAPVTLSFAFLTTYSICQEK